MSSGNSGCAGRIHSPPELATHLLERLAANGEDSASEVSMKTHDWGTVCDHSVLEHLEPRLLLDGGPVNVEGHLAALPGTPPSQAAPLSASMTVPDSSDPSPIPDLLTFDEAGRVFVDVWTRIAPSEVAGPLAELGFTALHVSDTYRLLEGAMPISSLLAAAGLEGVVSITPVCRPITMVGAVTTQGDTVLGADDARALDPGFDGSGVKVGVLSDSYATWGEGLEGSLASGDLPGPDDPDGHTTPVEVLRDYGATSPPMDEGRAMLEIVHDLAPGAELAFHSAFYGELDFANGIRALAEAGCDVIVDDVMYLNEPWFQDGIIAQAVNEVVDAQGLTYVAAAGNEAGRVHAAPYRDAGGWHDFDVSEGLDTNLRISLPGGTYGGVVLQWSDPWYTADGVVNDFDLYIHNEDGSVRASATTDNLATQQPLEWDMWKPSRLTEAMDYDIAIRRVSGSGDVELKLWVYSGEMTEYAGGPSVLGHAGAQRAIAVGAVPAHDPDTVEEFSSAGPVTICYDPVGNPLPAPEVRNRPDVVATDAVNTTFFGKDIAEDADSFPNFTGTSAAAPHVAGIAALVLSANGEIAPEQMRSILTSTAVDLGEPGWDDVFGAGRVDALAAVSLAATVSDTTGPAAVVISPPPATPRRVTFAEVQFNEPLSPAAATAEANYQLHGAGDDHLLDTADDVPYLLAPDYDAQCHAVTLDIVSPTEALPIGSYRLTVSAAITDATGNPLNDGQDETYTFEVAPDSEPLAFSPTWTETVGNPLVAVNGAGRSATVWRYRFSTPIGYVASAIGLVIHDENGARVGGPLVVDTPYELDNIAVDMGADGSVVVVHTNRWEYYSKGVFTAVFSPDGGHLGGDIAQAFQMGEQADVAVLDGGGYVTVWTHDPWAEWGTRVRARLFDANGVAVGDAFELGSPNAGSAPAVAATADGGFVVAWVEGSEGGSDILAMRFDGDGVPVGEAWPVSTETRPEQSSPAIEACATTGDFVIAWHVDAGTPRVLTRRFASGGAPLGGESLAQTNARRPAVVMNDSGEMLLQWTRTGEPYAQRYDSEGDPVGDPFQVPGAAMGLDNGGAFLSVWEGPTGRWHIPPLPELPDLEIAKVSCPPGGTIGGRIYIGTTVHNATVGAAGPFAVQYYLSPDAEITGTGNDRALRAQPVAVGEMLGGQSVEIHSDVVVPGNLAEGTYWLGAIIDVGNTVVEEDEGDNTQSVPIELSSPPLLGPELLVNATTGGDQTKVALAALPDGGFVAVWSGNGVGDDDGVFFRRYDATLLPVGSEGCVTQTTAGQQSHPSVASDAAGTFVVTWTSADQDGSGSGVFARRFAANGTPLTEESRVNTYTEGDQYDADVAAADDGSFVIVWLSHGQAGLQTDVFGQRFDASGGPIDGEFQINTMNDRGCKAPSVIVLPTGGFLAGWTLLGPAWDYEIRYRAFDSGGVGGGESGLGKHHYVSSEYASASMVANADGRILLAWNQWKGKALGQWLSADLEPIGERFNLSLSGNPREQEVRLTALADGGFLAAWQVLEEDSWEVRALRFNADGTRRDGEWRVNSWTDDSQFRPAPVGLSDGKFAIAWSSGEQDGDGLGLFARAYGRPGGSSAELVAGEVSGPGATYMGGPLTLSGMSRNIGDLATGPFDAQYYLIAGPYWSTGFAIGDPVIAGGLGEGATWQDARTLTVPDTGLPAGTYYMGLAVDSGGDVAESVELDNLIVSANPVIICEDPPPDLQVTEAAVLNSTVARGREVTVRWSVANFGSGPAPATRWYDRVVFSMDDVCGNDDDMPADGEAFEHTAGLAQGAAYSRTETVSLPFAFTGNVRVFVEADYSHQLAEPAAEDNNSGAAPGRLAVTEPTSALPVAEGFEGGSIDAVPGCWAVDYGPEGRVRVLDSYGPHGGQYHLVMDAVDWDRMIESAILTVDLSSNSDVVLRYWHREVNGDNNDWMPDTFTDLAGGDGVAMSADGVNWYRLDSLVVDNARSYYQQHVIDLDAEAARRGIQYDERFYILFQHEDTYSAPSTAFGFDDISLTVDTSDLYGPKVTGLAPVTVPADAGPLSQIVLTFDEPVDPASFTGQDVSAADPQGHAVEPVTVSPVPGSGDTQFALTFPGQDVRGTYHFSVKSSVADAAGNLMNADGDYINGEEDDGYDATLVFAPAPKLAEATTNLFSEGFESWPAPPAWWAFETTASNAVEAVSDDVPHGGANHLLLLPDTSAAALLDLSAASAETDLWLSFWAQRQGYDWGGQFYVELSTDGETWHEALSDDPPTSYGHYAVDLDEAVTGAGITLDDPVYIRFRNQRRTSGNRIYLDDLRVTTDVTGPRVSDSSIADGSVMAAGYLACTIRFDEELDLDGLDGSAFELVGQATGACTPTVWSYDAAAATLSLTYEAVPVDAYVLTVRDTTTDRAGNALDGNDDGQVGGNFETSFTLTVPGDANGDWRVDYLDYIRMKRHIGTAEGGSWRQADFDGDGGVDRTDFLLLRANFGKAIESPAPLAVEGEAADGSPAPADSPAALPAAEANRGNAPIAPWFAETVARRVRGRGDSVGRTTVRTRVPELVGKLAARLPAAARARRGPIRLASSRRRIAAPREARPLAGGAELPLTDVLAAPRLRMGYLRPLGR